MVFVGGYPGSGKSEFARALARVTSWALLDKDTIARPLIESVLEDLGHSVDDRESEIYVDRLRPREYAALEDVINDNVAVGTSVIATAPFIAEFGSRAWLSRIMTRSGTDDADCTFVWIRCSLDTMLRNLGRRGAGRDSGELADWDRYSAGLDLDFRPDVEHVVVDNDPHSPPLRTQAQHLIDSFDTEAGQCGPD